MIKIEKTEVMGWEPAVRGMRNPMNSWKNSDSHFWDLTELEDWPHKMVKYENLKIGPNDRDLMMRLAKAGSVHGKFRRMIVVYADITAPFYWWKEFDTYKVGTVANSCSTMHKIQDTPINTDAFSLEHTILCDVGHKYLEELDKLRLKFIETGKKDYWYALIQLLPQSYNQKRTVMLNYEVLANIYRYRRDHKLDEWRELCKWIESLPCSELITCNSDKEES